MDIQTANIKNDKINNLNTSSGQKNLGLNKLIILVPKLPKRKNIKPTISAPINLNQFPDSMPAILARDSLKKFNLSVESTIEWISQNGAKIRRLPEPELFGKNTASDNAAIGIDIFKNPKFLFKTSTNETTISAPKTNTPP